MTKDLLERAEIDSVYTRNLGNDDAIQRKFQKMVGSRKWGAIVVILLTKLVNGD